MEKSIDGLTDRPIDRLTALMLDPAGAKSEARRQMHLGFPQQSVGMLEQVLRLNPLDAEANALMGAALSQSGSEAAAVPYFEQAVRLEPNRAANHFNLGVAYERAGNPAWAIEGYRQALLRDADFLQAATAYYRLAPEYAPAPPVDTATPLNMANPTAAQAAAIANPTGLPTAATHPWREAPPIVKSARFLNFSLFGLYLLVFLMAVLAGTVGGEPDASTWIAGILTVICAPLFLWLAIAHRRGARAAWTTQMIVSIIGLVFFPLGTLINGYLLAYWFRPDVKAWFGIPIVPSKPM